MLSKRNVSSKMWTRIALLAVAVTVSVHGTAQSSRIEKPIVLDGYTAMKKMDVYRALAELTFRAYERGDHDTAKTLGQILNAAWNNTERITSNGEGQGRLEKRNRDLCMKIDHAMDEFIEPITRENSPDLSRIEQALNGYLEVLKLAD